VPVAIGDNGDGDALNVSAPLAARLGIPLDHDAWTVLQMADIRFVKIGAHALVAKSASAEGACPARQKQYAQPGCQRHRSRNGRAKNSLRQNMAGGGKIFLGVSNGCARTGYFRR
jgi:hypothetical protein